MNQCTNNQYHYGTPKGKLELEIGLCLMIRRSTRGAARLSCHLSSFISTNYTRKGDIMSTDVKESKQVQWQVITDADAIEVARDIFLAKKAEDDARNHYEQKLLGTPSIWMSKASDATIAKGSGVSKQMISIYRRTGRVLSLAPSDGVSPREVAELVNKAFNAAGSLGANVDSVLDEYTMTTDTPTWAGAMRAIKAALKPETMPKTDAEKVDGFIKNLVKMSDKGYSLSAEQRELLNSLK